MPGSLRSIPRDWPSARQAWLETAMILLLAIASGAQPTPAVNEAHYLAKARHFWNPQWCAGDAFLESADAHWYFQATLGWLTSVLPLDAAAWVGRLICWTLLAYGWRRLSFAAVPQAWISVLSAGWMFMFVKHGHMAGEWLVGGVEAKCLAYPFVLLALASVLQGRWSAAWLQLGVATLMHVLVGGWAIACMLVVRGWCLRRGQRPTVGETSAAVAGVMAAIAGLWPALQLDRGVSPDLAAEARRIYVYHRLPHHLVFHRFDRVHTASHLALWMVAIAAAAWLRIRDPKAFARLAPIWIVAVGAGLLALIGIAIDQLWIDQPQWSAGWLRFYWFRLADVMTPIALSLAIAWHLGPWETLRRRAPAILALAVVSALAWPLWQACRHLKEPPTTVSLTGISSSLAREREQHWRNACRWIRSSVPVSARFLTPPHQRSFKWWAEHPEVWTWKDVPQDAKGVLQWKALRDDIMPRLTRDDPGELPDLMQRYDARYYVWDRGAYPPPRDSRLKRCYPPESDPDAWFVVYQWRTDHEPQ